MNYDISASLGPVPSAHVDGYVAFLAKGRAVDVKSARQELQRATATALAFSEEAIVAVGAIKGKRPDYASQIAKYSGFSFDENMPELGYIAVESSHRGNGLSHRIVSELLGLTPNAPLFATTYNDRMKHVLLKAGFEKRGNEWRSQMSPGQMLSLWIKR